MPASRRGYHGRLLPRPRPAGFPVSWPPLARLLSVQPSVHHPGLLDDRFFLLILLILLSLLLCVPRARLCGVLSGAGQRGVRKACAGIAERRRRNARNRVGNLRRSCTRRRPTRRCSCSACCSAKAGLIDFLQEDMGAYTDAQVGAAARVVHDQCKRALDAHLKLERIRSEAEGSRVHACRKGFSPSEIRLIGNVVGRAARSRRALARRLARAQHRAAAS